MVKYKLKRGKILKHIEVNEIGLIRKSNQDRVLALENDAGFLAIVCDGIGGGKAGDVASEMVVDTFREAFLKKPSFNDDKDMIVWFKEVLEKANLAVFQKSTTSKEFAGMGTTLIGVLIHQQRAIGFNIGDSRLYEFRHRKLNLLSHDQTYAYQMYLKNEITKEEVEHHPRKNVLINAIGIKDYIEYEMIRVIDGWDRLMLSSDGLHDFVDHTFIEQTISYSLDQSAEFLKTLAYEAGGFDNISFIIIEDDNHE